MVTATAFDAATDNTTDNAPASKNLDTAKIRDKFEWLTTCILIGRAGWDYCEYERVCNTYIPELKGYLETLGSPEDLTASYIQCVEHYNRKATNYNKSHKGANLPILSTNLKADSVIAAACNGDKFNGLTLNSMTEPEAKFFADKLAALSNKVSIHNAKDCIVISTGENFVVKIPYERLTEDEIAFGFDWVQFTQDYWNKITTKDQFNAAGQYLGIIKRAPYSSAIPKFPYKLIQNEISLFDDEYDKKHPVQTEIPELTPEILDNPTDHEYPDIKSATVTRWDFAFNSIQSLAPADYQIKVLGRDQILFAADNGFGFVVVLYSSDAVAPNNMLVRDKIRRVDFGRVVDGKLQYSNSSDKVLRFIHGADNDFNRADLLDWFNLPADTPAFNPPTYAAPVKTDNIYRPTIFSRTGKKIPGDPSAIIDDSLNCDSLNGALIIIDGKIKTIVRECISNGNNIGMRLALGDFDNKFVNPNGGEVILGFEYVDIDTDNGDIASIDIPKAFCRGMLSKIKSVEIYPVDTAAREKAEIDKAFEVESAQKNFVAAKKRIDKLQKKYEQLAQQFYGAEWNALMDIADDNARFAAHQKYMDDHSALLDAMDKCRAELEGAAAEKFNNALFKLREVIGMERARAFIDRVNGYKTYQN